MHQHSCSCHKEEDISVQIPVRRGELAEIAPLLFCQRIFFTIL
jgi:hypothetical protein